VLRLLHGEFLTFESEAPMSENGQTAKKNKTQLIGFRVDEDAFSEIENRAILAGKTPNDWCRDELLARLGDGIMLTANEELIYSEIIRCGSVLATFLNLLAQGQLNQEAGKKLFATFGVNGMKLGREYFSHLAKKVREEGA